MTQYNISLKYIMPVEIIKAKVALKPLLLKKMMTLTFNSIKVATLDTHTTKYK